MNAQRIGSGRVELPLRIKHDQRPTVLASLPGCHQRNEIGSVTPAMIAGRDPFNQRTTPVPASGEQPVNRLATAGHDTAIVNAAGRFQAMNFLPESFDGRPEVGIRKRETGGGRPETGDGRPETGGRRPETGMGGRKPGLGSRGLTLRVENSAFLRSHF